MKAIHNLHIERIQFGKKSPTYWITVKNKISRSEHRLTAVTKDDILKIIECIDQIEEIAKELSNYESSHQDNFKL